MQYQVFHKEGPNTFWQNWTEEDTFIPVAWINEATDPEDVFIRTQNGEQPFSEVVDTFYPENPTRSTSEGDIIVEFGENGMVRRVLEVAMMGFNDVTARWMFEIHPNLFK